jgi:DNA (cytosine-5)-methyltransferase 1
MRELSLFTGIGGGLLGGLLLGWEVIAAVEKNKYCRDILKARQKDKILNDFPIYEDIITFDGLKYRDKVDIITGGFPCQDLSSARGRRGRGLNGKKSGLWFEMQRIIHEIYPPLIFIENVPRLLNNGFEVILNALSEMGYDAAWGVFSAGELGARHKRERIWVVGKNRNSHSIRPYKRGKIFKRGQNPLRNMQRDEWPTEYLLDRMSDGFSIWMEQNRALGNAQIPAVAALAFIILYDELMKNIKN